MANAAQRKAARAAVAALGLTPRQVRAQARVWGRRGVPVSRWVQYARDVRALLRAAARDGRPPTARQIRQVARRHGRQLLRWNGRKYDTKLGRALGLAPGTVAPAERTDAIDPDLESEILQSWIRENVALIKGASQEQIARITAATFRAQRAGTRAADLQTEISAILRAGDNRARLIARDQLGKFNGQVERLKQSDAGIDGFIWRDSNDERVRPRHRVLDGQRFPWRRPPPEGVPGQPVQCRCQAEPDLSGLLGDEFA